MVIKHDSEYAHGIVLKMFLFIYGQKGNIYRLLFDFESHVIRPKSFRRFFVLLVDPSAVEGSDQSQRKLAEYISKYAMYYTGSRLQRVRFQSAPGYNGQISWHQNHCLQC